MSTRCQWAGSDPAMVAYHDQEWGVPEHRDQVLFEFLLLEGAQAGLAWSTILRKRENYRKAYDQFQVEKIAEYSAPEVRALLNDPGIVRNRLKIAASIQNARRFLEVQREFGSFDAFVWRFVGGRPVVNKHRHLSEYPATTPASDALSKELKRRGFKFVGSTICYAFMQAVGMVNDHATDCFRYREVKKEARFG
jgi:DNA-3-methyladenine glycosylase I